MNSTQLTSQWFEAGMQEFAKARYEPSIEHFTRAIEEAKESVIAYVSRGAAYLKLGMLDSARRDLDRAIDLNPDNARAYHLRGLIREKQGQDNKALADFDRAIDLNPDYGAAYYSRATLHGRHDHAEQAQADIQMVAHLGQRNLESYMAENNVWHTQHMRVEDALETELLR